MSFRHVGVNAVFLLPGMGGLETYVGELVPALATARPDLRITVFASPAGAGPLRERAWADAVRVVTHPLLGFPGGKAVTETTLLGALAPRRGVDVVHSVAQTGPIATRAAHVVTLHDLAFLEPALPADRLTFAIWRTLVPPVARRADRVVAVSHATARDVVARLGIPAERIDVVHNGFGAVDRGTPTPERVLRERFGLGDRPFVLHVGQMRPHRNLLRVIGALPAVRARVRGAALVLAGAPSAHTEDLRAEAARLGLAGDVVFTGYLERADVEGLYAAARCCVMPSLREGFGLPVLEAQARGVPLACSTAEPLPEVGGDAARWFDPQDGGAIAAALTELLVDDGMAADLAARGRANAARFTWERTAEGTLEAYERAWVSRRP